MKISVVIPAKNEEKYIERCLKSFRDQDFNSYEIIVVDGRSSDRTREIARKYAKVVIQNGFGVSNARNYGADIAKGDVLVFSDADTFVEREFLSVVWREFQKNIGGGVPHIIPYDFQNHLIRFGYKSLEKMIHVSIKLGFGASIGSCFVYDRYVFDDVGGFDEKLLTNEDTDLALRTSRVSKFKIIPTNVFISARRANRQPFKYAYRSAAAFLLYSLKRRSYPPYWYDF